MTSGPCFETRRLVYLPEVRSHRDARETRVQMLLSEVRGVAPGRVITMPSHEEHILRILGEATESLFTSEIAERLNLQLRPATAYRTIEVGRVLQNLHEQVVQLADGRWILKP